MDRQCGAVLQEGLCMEVLSWKMHKEAPTACSLISQALNTGQAVALRATELTAVAVLTGTITKELLSAVAEEPCSRLRRRKCGKR